MVARPKQVLHGSNEVRSLELKRASTLNSVKAITVRHTNKLHNVI